MKQEYKGQLLKLKNKNMIEKIKPETRDPLKVFMDFMEKEGLEIKPYLDPPVQCADGSVILRPKVNVAFKPRA